MKLFSILSVAYAALAAAAPFASASADSAEAMCEVRKDGDTKRGASGPCTFSQRQGYVDLDLRNGDTYSLAPGNKSGHYKDQKGNKVVRTSAGNSEEFKWEGGKKIIVTWASSPSTHHQGSSSYRAGDTAPDLSDLVGAKAGQAEGELERRGYTYATGSTSGNAKYSSWFNRSTGRCVMIRTEQGRYQSIVQTSPVDCGR
jgi:hypothetical protein